MFMWSYTFPLSTPALLFRQELRAGCEKATKALTSAEKAAEEIAQIQKQLKSKASEVTSLRDKLDSREREISVST